MGIKNYLIDGVSCAGKTTVCDELQRRGYHAIHGDRELAYWGDPKTGKPVNGCAGEHRTWMWNVEKVRALVADQNHAATFFCGGSRNSDRFIDLLDGVFVLEIDLDTLRHLLTHTSGIPDYFDEDKITDVNNFTLSIPWYELRGPRDYLAVFPDEEMKFTPGERFAYSNGGYIILGVVIEELTGMKYQDFVAQAIFQAIGMHQSGYFALNKLPEKTALGYVKEDGGWRTNIYNLPIVGASDGGAFTTVHDLMTLWAAFWGGEIVSKEFVELYAVPYVKAETEGTNTYYGHGLWINEDAGREREVYIMGGDAGVDFKSSLYQNANLQVTVISNTTNGAWPLLRVIESALK